MFDTIIKNAAQSVNKKKIEKVRQSNELLIKSDRPRRFVMIAFDQK